MGCSGSTPNLSKRQRRSKRQGQSHKEQQETNNESTNYPSGEEESTNSSPVLPPHFGHHIIHPGQSRNEQQQSHPEPGRGGVQEFSFLSSAPTTDLLRPHQQNQFKNSEFMERSNLEDRHNDRVASQDRKHLPRASTDDIAKEWSGLFFSDGAEQLVGNERTDNNPLSIDGCHSNQRDDHDHHNHPQKSDSNNLNKTSTPGSVSPASDSHTPWELSSRTQTFPQRSSPSLAADSDVADNLFSDENEAYEAYMQRMAEFESESSNNSSLSASSSF